MRKWVIFVCTLIIFNAFAKDGELSLDEKREIYRNELLDEKAQDDLSNTLNDHKLWLKKQADKKARGDYSEYQGLYDSLPQGDGYDNLTQDEARAIIDWARHGHKDDKNYKEDVDVPKLRRHELNKKQEMRIERARDFMQGSNKIPELDEEYIKEAPKKREEAIKSLQNWALGDSK